MIFIKFFAWSVFTRIPVWAVCKLNNCDDIVRVEIVLAAGVFRGGSIPLFLLSWLLPLHCFQCLYCHFFIITFRQPFFMFLSWKRLNLTTWFIFCIDSSKILFQLPRLSVHGGPWWSVVRGGPSFRPHKKLLYFRVSVTLAWSGPYAPPEELDSTRVAGTF